MADPRSCLLVSLLHLAKFQPEIKLSCVGFVALQLLRGCIQNFPELVDPN